MFAPADELELWLTEGERWWTVDAGEVREIYGQVEVVPAFTTPQAKAC